MIKKKVLHIITGLNDGGAEAALYRLCVNALEFDHHIVSMMDIGKYGPLFQSSGIPVYTLQMPQGKITVKGLISLRKTIYSLNPDVVQTWMYHANLIGGIVAWFAGVRSVIWGVHHSNLNRGTVKQSTIYVARAGALLSKIIPNSIVSCSEQAVKSHQKIGYYQSRFVVIPNGYDLTHFQPDKIAGDELRASWGISKGFPLFGMVARFDPQKDHGNLIASLGQLKRAGARFTCVLIGSGMDISNNDLTALIGAHGLGKELILLGQRSDIPAVMNAIDIHVLSSLGEAFPNVLAEAMACGTPCVSTNVGDAELIVGNTGWIVEPSAPTKLAQALGDALDAMKNPEIWNARCRAVRHRIKEKFDMERMVRSYSNVWQN